MASGPNAIIINIVLSWVFMAAPRGPFSWNKNAEGITYEWIGFAQYIARFRVGISQSRADWLVKRIDSKLATDRITAKETSEVLGRLNLAALVVDITKPFLGPIYRWAASVPEFAVMKVPILIEIILLMRCLTTRKSFIQERTRRRQNENL